MKNIITNNISSFIIGIEIIRIQFSMVIYNGIVGKTLYAIFVTFL